MRKVFKGTRNMKFLKDFVCFADDGGGGGVEPWTLLLPLPPLLHLILPLTSLEGERMEIWSGRCLTELKEVGCKGNSQHDKQWLRTRHCADAVQKLHNYDS